MYHSAALAADGTLWAWGNNSWGELGRGDTFWRFTPNPVGTDANWKSVTVGGFHNLALKPDGSLLGLGAEFLRPVR